MKKYNKSRSHLNKAEGGNETGCMRYIRKKGDFKVFSLYTDSMHFPLIELLLSCQNSLLSFSQAFNS